MIGKRGSALILVFIFVIVLLIFGSTVIQRGIGESRIIQHYREATESFWLAEAGANWAQDQLRQNPNFPSGTNLSLTTLGQGQYNFDLTNTGNPGVRNYTVTSRGCFPDGCNCGANCRVIRTLVVGMHQLENSPANFYSNAIYTAGNVSGGSSANSLVTGNLVYGGTNSYPVSKVVEGVPTHSATNPLALLNFTQLRAISQSQLHYNPGIAPGNTWPSSFWFEAPSESNPTGTPNVVFVEGDFSISGNTTRYGFIVVGGEVTHNATISGTSSIVGGIYARGNFTINGGGNALNVDGGVWAGGSVNMGGNGRVSFNAGYLNAVQALGITTDVQVNSWHDTQNPYNLIP